MIVAGILMISSFLAYAGGSYFSKIFVSKYNNQYLIQNQFHQEFQTKMENIMKKYTNSIFSSDTLQRLVYQYNNTFSNDKNEYRISFNNIYFNSETCNYMKFLIKNMDNSRLIIFTQIIEFSNKYVLFSESIQNTIETINEKGINPITKINIKKDSSDPNTTAINLIYIYASGIIIFVIVYSIIFFYDNSCTRCCSCIYSFFALVILTLAVSSLFIGDSMYANPSYCVYKYKYQKYETEKLIFDLKNCIDDFNINDSFDENEIELIENLSQSINSNMIHKNYMDIYSQYSHDSLYKKDLSNMVRIIKMNDKKLVRIKNLFDDISNFSLSIYPIINEILNNTHRSLNKPSKNENDQDFTDEILKKVFPEIDDKNAIIKIKSSNCQTLVDGSNCCLVSFLFVCIGLLSMAIFIWLKRSGKCVVKTNDKSIQIKNSHANQKPLRTIYLGKKIVYSAIYVQSTESISVAVSQFSSPNQIITIMQGKYEKSHSIESYMCRKGKFGDGFYFSSNKRDALIELVSFSNHQIDINKVGFLVCRVDFGNSLEVSIEKFNYFSFPNSLNEYQCNSVCGERNDLPDEFIVYDIDRIDPIDIQIASDQDF